MVKKHCLPVDRETKRRPRTHNLVSAREELSSERLTFKDNFIYCIADLMVVII